MNRLNTSINKTAKLTIAIVMVTFFSTFLKAQKNINFGLKATPGIYWLTSATDSTKNDGTKFGFGYGAMLEFGLTDNYFLVTGVDIVAAGAKSKTETINGGISTTIARDFKIQYLQIPLFLKMKTKEIGMIKYFGQFGLGTGFALSTKTTTKTTIGSTVTSIPDTKKDNIFPIRASLLIGFGMEYNISGSTSLVVGATFDNGFTPLLKEKDSSTTPSKTNPSLKSKGITLSVGILF